MSAQLIVVSVWKAKPKFESLKAVIAHFAALFGLTLHVILLPAPRSSLLSSLHVFGTFKHPRHTQSEHMLLPAAGAYALNRIPDPHLVNSDSNSFNRRLEAGLPIFSIARTTCSSMTYTVETRVRHLADDQPQEHLPH